MINFIFSFSRASMLLFEANHLSIMMVASFIPLSCKLILKALNNEKRCFSVATDKLNDHKPMPLIVANYQDRPLECRNRIGKKVFDSRCDAILFIGIYLVCLIVN